MNTQPDLPPHNLEAEKAILGSVLLDAEILPDLIERINSEMFFDVQHRKIFVAMLQLHQEERAIDVVSLAACIPSDSWSYLSTLPEACPHSMNWPDYAEQIKGCHNRRGVIQLLDRALTTARQRPIDLERFQTEIQKLAPASKECRTMSLGDILPEVLQTIEQEMAGTTLAGISTGFIDLDHYTGGLQNGELIVMASRPSIGKTSLAMNIVERCNVPVGVFSLEMNRVSIAKRMLASQASVNLRDLRNRRISERDMMGIKNAVVIIRKSQIQIDDTPAIDIVGLKKSARDMHKKHGVKLIVVDYLQLMSSETRNGENREREVAQVSNGLKALANELNIPVLVLAQLNRMIEHGKGRRPRLSDLRESGAIEQDADTVLFLYRDDSEELPDLECESVKLLIGKQRNGPRDVEIQLTFLKKFTRFESAARVDTSDVPNKSRLPYNE